jgi:hypothetical protein
VRLISVDSNEQSRIRIPFVSSGATWIEGEADEEEDGLVVSLIPPPKHDDDTIIVKYCEQDLEPQLEQVWGDSDSEE